MCYECTKNIEIIRERNMEWEREGETEENTKKNGNHARCSNCNGSSDPLEESIIIDELPFRPLSPLSPMDDTPGTAGEEKGGEYEGEITEVGWEECIGNLVEEDKESIKDGKFLTDAIIRIIMKFIQEWLKNSGGKGEKVSCLDPVTVQMIRKQATSEKASKDAVEDIIRDVVEVINKGDFKNKDYIMMPVNDNEDPDRDAGSHWSLLIFRKKDRKFYHYDSISGANDRYARRLIGRMSRADPWFRNELMTVKCPKQNDGHSCGIYTIMNACKIAGSIADLDKGNTEVNNEMEMEVEQRGDVAKTRNWVKDIISIRKDVNNRKDILKTQEMIFYGK